VGAEEDLMTKPPCYDEATHNDCPDRCIGCKAECERWRKWLAIHEAEKEAQRQDRQNPADDFLIGQQERVKKARHRDYMRGYRK
jgi:hypothetical protein